METNEIVEPLALASPSDQKQRKLKAAQIRLVYAHSGTGSLGALLGAVILGCAFWKVVPDDRIVAWVLTYGALFVGRHCLIHYFHKREPDEDDVIRWGKWHTLAVSLGGLMWGVAGVWLFPHDSILDQFLLAIFVAGIGAASIVVYSPTTDYAFNLLPALLPLSGRFIYEFDQFHVITGSVILLYAGVLLQTGRRMHSVYAHSLMLTYEKEELVEHLQQEIVERDRLQAELQTAHDDLETRVDARTDQLKSVNSELQQKIEELKQIEEELRKSEEKYRLLADNATDIVWTLDLATMKFTHVSPSVQKIRGYSAVEAAELPLDKTLTPDSHARAVTMLAAEIGSDREPGANLDRTRLVELQEFCKDGSIIETEARIKFLRDANGIPTGLLGITRDITDRKQAEQLLKESEARYRLLVENAYELILVAQDGKFVFSNPRGLELSGYSEEEVTSRPFLEFVHPDDRHTAAELYQEAMEGEGARKTRVFRVIDRWGKVRWGHVGAVRIEWDGRPAALIFGIEITDLKQAEEALRESEQRFRALAEGAPFGLALINENGTLAYINPKFKELFGYSLEEIPNGREWFRKAFPDAKYRHNVISTWIDDSKAARTGQVQPRVFTVRRRDGAEKIVSFILLSLSSGQHTVTCEDITERRRTEELAIRNERLKAIGDLAGGVAHNFNNLLQMVMSGLDLALVDLGTGNVAEPKKTLEQLLQVSRSGAEVVRRLQSFAQVGGKIQPAEGEAFDLSETVKQTAEMTKPLWKTKPDKKGISIALNLELAERCFVNAKESEITEALVNLVKNAAEALPGGGEIRIKTFIEDNQVILQVSDDGMGIKREDLKKVFEPFWSTKGVAAGTGMGLAVSHGIISRHGGTISVESDEGKQTIFTVALPLAKAPQSAPVPSGPETLRSKLNILVIDDIALIVMHLKEILRKHGQTVFSAMSGEEGMEIFRNNKIDLVICDLGMRGMNGYEVGKVVQEVCHERRIPKTPFILLTGWDIKAEEQDKLVESGVDAVLKKPLDTKKLLAHISKVVETAAPLE
jgi:two-component system cell cycle sensor histidine kinase/response regulator CckA